MKLTKSISIALMIATVSSLAQSAQPVDQYGRGSKDVSIAGSVPGTGAAVAVSEVQGRGSVTPGTIAHKVAPVMLSDRTVDSLGRS